MSRPRPIERRVRAPQRGRSLHPLMERAPPLARVNPTHGQDMSARPPSVHTGRNHLRHRAPGPGTRNRRVPSADHAARKRPPVSDFIFFRFLRVSLQNLSTLPAAPDRLPLRTLTRPFRATLSPRHRGILRTKHRLGPSEISSFSCHNVHILAAAFHANPLPSSGQLTIRYVLGCNLAKEASIKSFIKHVWTTCTQPCTQVMYYI